MLSAVTPAAFGAFTRPQQMAFLINAYNAFTIELVLTEYPKLKSIKDVTVFGSPWKKPFFTLLGEQRHLDWIEHEQLRPKYNEPRIHTAIVCASIGCPALRSEAFTSDKLEEQLEDGMRRFLGDATRNRAALDKLEVSSIFKWFREDFEKGHQGFQQVEDVFARYAPLLSGDAGGAGAAEGPQAQAAVPRLRLVAQRRRPLSPPTDNAPRPTVTTDARTLILFGYDWDASAFARLKHDWPADHAGFDLFTFPSYLRLATFDLQRFVDDLAMRARRRGWQAVVSHHEQFGALGAALLAERMGWPGTPVAAVLACQHKLLCASGAAARGTRRQRAVRAARRALRRPDPARAVVIRRSPSR